MIKANSLKESPDFLTATEVAGWLRVPKSTVYKLCQEGQIPATKIGRHWRFHRATIEQWIRREWDPSTLPTATRRRTRKEFS